MSHSGEYKVEFHNSSINDLDLINLGSHFIIDKNVFSLLGEKFFSQINKKEIVFIDATEESKSYQKIESTINELIEKKLNRSSHLVAIGGGITQDITCFIATTFMRGLEWTFVPTTLLAQADSCIGSKSSINFGKYKNILGSFYPPKKVIISEHFLKSLDEKDIKSGIGEIIKLYIIDGKLIDSNTIRSNLSLHLYKTLQIKKTFIEEDEFDKGIRNILNYGHCFGHAIESASNFDIPHGIAITIGMDIANRLALEEKLISHEFYSDLHTILLDNYLDYVDYKLNKQKIYDALSKDKKNTGNTINIILPVGHILNKKSFNNDREFWDLLDKVLSSVPIKIQS
jgi:3-dehydroquinate synthase